MTINKNLPGDFVYGIVGIKIMKKKLFFSVWLFCVNFFCIKTNVLWWCGHMLHEIA